MSFYTLKTFDLVPKLLETFDLVPKLLETFDLVPFDLVINSPIFGVDNVGKLKN